MQIMLDENPQFCKMLNDVGRKQATIKDIDIAKMLEACTTWDADNTQNTHSSLVKAVELALLQHQHRGCKCCHNTFLIHNRGIRAYRNKLCRRCVRGMWRRISVINCRMIVMQDVKSAKQNFMLQRCVRITGKMMCHIHVSCQMYHP